MSADELRVVPLLLEHAAATHAWMQDPEVARNVGLRRASTLEGARGWIAKALADPTVAPLAVLRGDEHVGNVILDHIDDYLGSARLSIYVGPRGQGLGKAALRLALAEAFGARGLHKVWLTVHVQNARAIQAYVAVGFRVEGVLRGEFLLDGVRVDALRMGILRDEQRP